MTHPARRPATVAEGRALAHPLRLRILRLCLDAPRTNRELADHLGMDPATVLHHVRTLARTGFLAADPSRRGRRGAREIPYRSTGKSWTLDLSGLEDPGAGLTAMHDAVRAELLEAGTDPLLTQARLAVTIESTQLEEFERRLGALIDDLDAWDRGARVRSRGSAEDMPADASGGTPIAIYVVAHRRTPGGTGPG